MRTLSSLNWGILEIIFLIIVFVATFIVTLKIVPFVIKVMKKRGYVGKDIHKNAQPEVAESGGLSIIIGIVVASVLLMIFFSLFLWEILVFMLTVVSAGAIGFIDDRIKLRSRYKMILTFGAGGIIFLANYLNFIDIQSPTIPFLGKTRLTIIYPLAVPVIVAVFCNTSNMLEGYNGEGSGTILIAACFLFVCALIWNSAEGLLFVVVTIAVLIPFFLSNKYPAKVFPGDIGTLSMGAIMACIALMGSLEVAVFCAMLIHVFNSFYVISSVRGFFESSEIQEEKNDIILLDDDRIMASDQKDAALTLPRLVLAKGPLTEPDLVKNFFIISIICGFFAITAALMMRWTMGTIDGIIVIIVIAALVVPTLYLLKNYPRIRGIVIFMVILLGIGMLFMIFTKLVIMPWCDDHLPFPYYEIKIPIPDRGMVIRIPVNLVVTGIIAIPGFLVWYLITIKYFWIEIKKMKKINAVN